MSVQARVCNRPTCRVLLCLPADPARQGAVAGRRTALPSDTHACVRGAGDRRGPPPPTPDPTACRAHSFPPFLGSQQPPMSRARDSLCRSERGSFCKAVTGQKRAPPRNTHSHTRSHSEKGLSACVCVWRGTSRNVFLCVISHTHTSETLFLSSWKIPCLFRSRTRCLSLTNTHPRAASTVSHNREADSFCACDCVCTSVNTHISTNRRGVSRVCFLPTETCAPFSRQKEPPQAHTPTRVH